MQLIQFPISEIKKKYDPVGDRLFVDVKEGEWFTRSMGTDLSYPILMLEEPNGEWDVIDGNHRIWKAWKTGQLSIMGYLIREKELPPPDQL